MGQQFQIIVRAPGAGRVILGNWWNVPRGHIVVPGKAADDHQRMIRDMGQGLAHFAVVLLIGVQINDRAIGRGAGVYPDLLAGSLKPAWLQLFFFHFK